jgi:hypothetical protein
MVWESWQPTQKRILCIYIGYIYMNIWLKIFRMFPSSLVQFAAIVLYYSQVHGPCMSIVTKNFKQSVMLHCPYAATCCLSYKCVYIYCEAKFSHLIIGSCHEYSWCFCLSCEIFHNFGGNKISDSCLDWWPEWCYSGVCASLNLCLCVCGNLARMMQQILRMWTGPS